MFTFLHWIDTKPLWVRVTVNLLIAAYVIRAGQYHHPANWLLVTGGGGIVLLAVDEVWRDKRTKRDEGGDDATG
jgi:hypothetical protein